MTNEEALKGFEDFCEVCKAHCNEAGAVLGCNFCKVKNAKTVIGKHIPKKPTDIMGGDKTCPCCGAIVRASQSAIISEYRFVTFKVTIAYRYCQDCGQAIDWSEDDDK